MGLASDAGTRISKKNALSSIKRYRKASYSINKMVYYVNKWTVCVHGQWEGISRSFSFRETIENVTQFHILSTII